jgi:hypothetical protein
MNATNFNKGDKLVVVTGKNSVVPEDVVTVNKVVRRSGITRVYVWSELGHGYAIRLEEFTALGNVILKV